MAFYQLWERRRARRPRERERRRRALGAREDAARARGGDHRAEPLERERRLEWEHLVTLRVHLGYTWGTLRLPLGYTWATLRVHLGYT